MVVDINNISTEELVQILKQQKSLSATIRAYSGFEEELMKLSESVVNDISSTQSIGNISYKSKKILLDTALSHLLKLEKL
ncbi:MAG: hypothetical protein MHMPM18_003834 [Marteilia pararefringens]